MANLTYAYRNDLDAKTGKLIETDLPTTSQDTSGYYDDFEGVLVKGENGEIYAAFDNHARNDPINMADVMEIEITEAPDGIQAMTILAQRGAGQPLDLNDQGTAEMEGEQDLDDLMGPIPQGLKYRKNRQRGGCKCPECGDTFINAARLERHLAVHQVFGSYLCPLCGKTYKYEYNLFYHWRRTCRDLNDLLGSTEERRTMDVNALRALVDEVASKKAEIGPIDIGISRSLLFQNGPVAKLEIPKNPLGHRGTACQACGLIVLTSHMERHIRIHRGDLQPDERSACGGYFCDLCGLMFRQHFNLIKHWRTACPEIQANLPENCELTLDDRQLKEMVKELIQKAATNHVEERDYKLPMMRNPSASGLGYYKRNEILDHDVGTLADEDQRYTEEQGLVFADDFVDEDVSGEMPSSSRSGEKEKWSMDSQPVNCPECFRSFANAGRLERHLAGFHASYGAHHCILCGNRFKYDYNLLYHYRHSCPYTRTFIMRDVREQMDAQSLRKMVRNLAQREVKLTPTITTSHRMFCSTKNPMISNDEMVRRQMLGKANHQPPPIMTVPKNGLTGKNCPICQIVFYGTAIELHMRRAHSVSWEDYLAQKERESAYESAFSGGMEEEDDAEEAPPKLEPEIDPSEPTTTEISQKETLISESEITQTKSTIIHIKKVNGTFVEVMIEGFEEGYLQTLIDSGQLELEPGDEIEIVGETEETEGPHEDQEVGVIEYEDLPQNDDY
ncbi:unnamed protein product, partial [Mesorhabditis belari]|uniref:C2H2-type domain-containing protein n=1 Tax=Mesorhabditis belari TaxID=2138241 RepID=A0AAF3FLQ0_9BILA